MRKIVIVGGGFAGSTAARKLEADFDVTLIDTKDYFEFTPGVLRTIVDPSHLDSIQVRHEDYLRQAKFVHDEVIRVKKDQVQTKDKAFDFDYLLLCCGSSYRLPFKEGDLVKASRGATLQRFHDELEKARSVLIVGGGVVGVELAGEIMDRYDKKITIVQGADKLMPRSEDRVRRYAENFLKKKGARIVYGSFVKDKKGKEFKTSQGSSIKADIGFMCTGITPNTGCLQKDYSASLGKRKHALVNEYLQLDGHKNIFCLGDMNNIREEKLAQTAERHACTAVQSIHNVEKGKEPIRYVPKKRPMIISLGRWDGILTYNRLTITGIIPAIMKNLIEKWEMWKIRNI